jgi:glycosyltransferase involved in cell wall biosynthesis
MNILFFRESEIKDIHAPALGATETCVTELAKALPHNVAVICPCTSKVQDNVQYVNHKDYISSVEFMKNFYPDIVIIAGNPKILFYGIKFSCNLIFWQQNHPDEMSYPIKELKCKIVFPSPEAAEYAKTVYNNKNIFGIYSGVRDVFKPSQEKEKNSICYVGSLVRTKGVLEVLKAAAQLKQYKFYICGSFDMYGYRDLEYERACLSIKSENIFYLGALSPTELANRISKSELCIVNPLVDNKETCCVSALESMACGTPVIAGKSLIEPIINHGGICTVNLVQSIQELMQNSELLKQLAENGKKWVSELSWSKVALEWQRPIF